MIGLVVREADGRKWWQSPGSRYENAVAADRNLRHDPAGRDAGGGIQPVAPGQADDRGEAGRAGGGLHRGGVSAVESEGRGVLPGDPLGGAAQREGGGVRDDAAARGAGGGRSGDAGAAG